MIFVIEDEFERFDWDSNAAFQRAIENLLLAHAEGWHSLALTQQMAKQLLNSQKLSEKSRSIINFLILEKRATLMGQALSAPRVVYCTVSRAAAEDIDERFLATPLLNFEDLENCGPSMLLVENTNRDGRVYVDLANQFSELFLSSAPLRYALQMGGGSTIGDELKRLERSTSRPMITIVDSDRTSPSGGLGSTASRVKSEKDPKKFWSVLEILPIRSIEGFVPPEIVSSCLAEEHPAQHYLSTAIRHRAPDKVGLNSSEDLWHFLSPKKPIKLGHVRKASKEFRKTQIDFLKDLGVCIKGFDLRKKDLDQTVLYNAELGDFIPTWIDKMDSKIVDRKEHLNLCLDCPLLRNIIGLLSAFGICQPRSAAY